MKERTALKAILIISVAGLLFSGYLSYNELMMRVCITGSCPALFNLPVCVYGFFMYLLTLIFSIAGLLGKKKK